MGEGEAELLGDHVVGQRASVRLQLHRFENVEAAFHRVADHGGVAAHEDVDRTRCVTEGAAEMAGADLTGVPDARAYRLVAFMDGVGLDELVALTPADAVDDQLGRAVKDDLEIVVGVRATGEEAGNVELARWGGGGGATEQGRRGKVHWRPATSASTMVGSASVEVSPRPSLAPSAILRRMRRMILPDRVLGSAGVKWIFSGAASAPMSWRTSWTNSLRSSSLPSSPAFNVTKA